MEQKISGGNNKGAVSVFLACMLLPMLALFAACFTLALLCAAKASISSAKLLALNGAKANYNHVIYENYGLLAYTKPAASISARANTYFNESSDVDGTVQVSLSDSLSSDSVLVAQIEQYMMNRDTLTRDLSPEDIDIFVGIMNQLGPIKENYNADLELARTPLPETPEIPELPAYIDADDGVEVPIPQEPILQEPTPEELQAQIAYDQAVCRNEQRKDDAAYRNWFTEISHDMLPEEQPVLIDNSPIAESGLDDMIIVSRACKAIEDVQAYYSNVEAVKGMIANRTSEYYVANYVTDMFSAYNYCGPCSLSGNYFQSGDIMSVCPWGENEYILYGNNSDYRNWDNMKNMIYKTFFVMHLLNRDCVGDMNEIQREAELLANGNENLIPMYKDEIEICLAAEQTKKDMWEIYSSESNPHLNWVYVSNGGQGLYMNYMYFSELFAYLETNRNLSVVLNRIRHVIDTNAQNSCEEAREFSSQTAYTSLQLSVDAPMN